MSVGVATPQHFLFSHTALPELPSQELYSWAVATS